MSKILTADVIRISAYITDQEGYTKRSDNPNVMCTADKVLFAVVGMRLYYGHILRPFPHCETKPFTGQGGDNSF